MMNELLYDLLSTPRPHNGVGIERITEKWFDDWWYDDIGNIIYRQGESDTLYSAHIDTIHLDTDLDRQELLISADNKFVSLKNDTDTCLGADNGAGVWLLYEMVAAGVPGLYIIHQGEEIGGIGSNYIAHHTPFLLTGIRRAIAFDRQGTNEIITHQGDRCCSDQFARELSQKLGMNHFLSSWGTFTDTANYTYLVEDCTNVAVGYYREHTKYEYLDLHYLRALLTRLIRLNHT